MRRDTKTFLEDIRIAVLLIVEMTTGRSLELYREDRMLKSAVERQFITIGEALRAIEKLDSVIAMRFSKRSRIIGFRNLLVHSYHKVEDDVVWDTLTGDLPNLLSEVEAFLDEFQ